MMMKLSRLLAMMLLVTVAACGDDEEERVGTDLSSADSLAMEPAHEPAAGMDRPPGGIGETAQIEDLAGTGIGGEVSVTDRGEQSQVVVRLTGLTPESEHPGHVHAGSCAAIGSVVEPLQPIAADSVGIGSITADVEIEPAVLTNGEHIVVYHGEGGRPIGCAEIPLPHVVDQSSTI